MTSCEVDRRETEKAEQELTGIFPKQRSTDVVGKGAAEHLWHKHSRRQDVRILS